MQQGSGLIQEQSHDLLVPDNALGRIVAISKALSDPIRVRMLGLLCRGRASMGLPPTGLLPIPGTDEIDGICVCEFQEAFQLGQSKVSYHLRVLREAGLVREEARGKWSFYSINRPALDELMGVFRTQFLP